MAQSILVVDDDPHIREIICFALAKAGYETLIAGDGAAALELFAASPTGLIVLDIGLPEMDGLEVCRQLRKTSEVPILFLSARDEEIDRVLGLEIGGDDYVVKPFSPRELVARVNAILKRSRPKPLPVGVGRFSHGGLELDAPGHVTLFANVLVELTAIEFAILKTLLARPSQVLTREQILDAAYPGACQVADRTIDSHIRNIRAKLAEAGCAHAVETVHGVGFKLGPCEKAT
ncbi:response regulator [Desulfovibrio aerotolerans]|uniref:Response regulator n=1 Tax=Solidesulfovibrio aerotolerans TaxID=295255 RepID=A0A7C9ISQ1_9BACT|nr:response regulator transcription factor [Solidesulfovibrio aerotolerans]MYL83487.1 response regulator [Solidesulfovibrio aerotolerans]